MRRVTKYLQLANQIHRDAVAAKLPPDEQLPSIRDLMEKYAAGKQTVCNALQYLAFEKQFLYHISKKGYFLAGKTGRRAYNIAFIDRPWGDIRLDGMLRMKEDIIKVLKHHSCNPCGIMMNDFLNTAKFEKIASSITGLLLSWSVIGEYADAGKLLKLKIPTVIFQGEYITDLPFSQIVPDHAVAMRELYRIYSPASFNGIVIFFCHYPNSTSRKDAFIHYALEAGFTPDQIDAIPFEDNATPYPFMLKNKERFLGKIILSTTDLLSDKIYNALDFLFAARPDAPKTILISYDNLDDCGIHPFASPVISSIDYSRQDMISLAIKQLLLEINDPRTYKTILQVPTRLLLRGSVFPKYIPH